MNNEERKNQERMERHAQNNVVSTFVEEIIKNYTGNEDSELIFGRYSYEGNSFTYIGNNDNCQSNNLYQSRKEWVEKVGKVGFDEGIKVDGTIIKEDNFYFVQGDSVYWCDLNINHGELVEQESKRETSNKVYAYVDHKLVEVDVNSTVLGETKTKGEKTI